MTSGSSSSKYSGANNAELKELEGVALAEKQKAEGAKRTGELVATLSKIDPANITKNHNIYAELAEINPTNSDYVTKAAHYNKKIKAQEQIAQTRKIKATQAAARKERIESLFSAWDGSLGKLEKHIKERMNNPDSYEHVETRYTDMGDHLRVATKYRGTNAFGGVVTQTTVADVDDNGNVIRIVQ